MEGWVIPPPKRPEKTKEEFSLERKEKVIWLIGRGFLKSERIKNAMLKVPREEFAVDEYRDYCYQEVPLPIPGESATVSCPHSYPLFYEALELKEGDKFLEVGAGSGYGAAVAREIVGDKGLVITIDIDPKTYEFAKGNLKRLGYQDVEVILGDGSLGYQPLAPYDKICVTAACPEIPLPLIEQLNVGGKLAAPIGGPHGVQDLVVLEKSPNGSVSSKVIEKVLYVPLRGKYGWH